MKLEILDTPPISGEFVEYKYDSFGECIWVKFCCKEREVVGVFGKGSLTQSSVTLFNNDQNVFIIASGQGYILELSTMVLTHKTKIDFLTHAIAISKTAAIAIGDNWSVRLYSPGGIFWEALNIASDDLRIETATESLVSGSLSESGRSSEFRLDITSAVATLG